MRARGGPILGLLLLLPLGGCVGGDGDDDDDDDSPDAMGPLSCETLAIEPVAIGDGETVGGATEGDSTTLPHEACFGAAAGPEAVYFLQLGETRDIVWRAEAARDLVLYIRADCDGLDGGGAGIPELACADAGVTGEEIAVLESAAPGAYYLFVDGYDVGDAGAFTASVTLRTVVGEGEACGDAARCEAGLYCDETGHCSTEDDCADWIDQDGDMLIDCQDPTSCAGTAACTPGAGPPGVPCTSAGDCAADAGDPACLDEATTGFPGGACAEFCDPWADDCPGDAACAALPGGGTVCLDGCAGDLDCRPGYVCEHTWTGAQVARVCLPGCTLADQCPVRGFCNLDTGRCAWLPEDCYLPADNDEDGRVLCEDRDCAADPACAPAIAGACEAAPLLEGTVESDTTGGLAVMAGSCVASSGALPERAFQVKPGVAGEIGVLSLVSFALTQANLALYVRRDCPDGGTEVVCVDQHGYG